MMCVVASSEVHDKERILLVSDNTKPSLTELLRPGEHG
jgi:hypothetical protein